MRPPQASNSVAHLYRDRHALRVRLRSNSLHWRRRNGGDGEFRFVMVGGQLTDLPPVAGQFLSEGWQPQSYRDKLIRREIVDAGQTNSIRGDLTLKQPNTYDQRSRLTHHCRTAPRSTHRPLWTSEIGEVL